MWFVPRPDNNEGAHNPPKGCCQPTAQRAPHPPVGVNLPPASAKRPYLASNCPLQCENLKQSVAVGGRRCESAPLAAK
eukprot:188612-Prorocentrum_minimum.AAC.1